MAITSPHPRYSQRYPQWIKMRDCYEGEDQIKSKREEYLPATRGMREDGMNSSQDEGYKAYQTYLTRAVFHDFVADAVENALGVMHNKPPKIELPPEMEPLRQRATIDGETLDMLLYQINEEQLVTGRVGILADLPEVPDPRGPLPYIALYHAETILNWDDATSANDRTRPRLNLVVLNESDFVRRSDFTWDQDERYRVLVLGELRENEVPGTAGAAYRQAIFEEDSVQGIDVNAEDSPFFAPMIRGRVATEVPFVIINKDDVVASPDRPPFLPVANLAMAAYRGEADYRQNLFLQAQDTLVTINGRYDDVRVGAGAHIRLKHGGDAKFIGVSADGLSEQRQAINADKAEANHKSGELVDTRSRPFESGEALKTRQAGHTTTLTSVANAGAFGLEMLLKQVATWMGANPDLVKVTPNRDFTVMGLMTRELLEAMNAKAMGAPWSLQQIHQVMRNRGLTELEFEAELEQIRREEALVMPDDDAPDGVGDDSEPADDATGDDAVEDGDEE